jgi:hypothetical protein
VLTASSIIHEAIDLTNLLHGAESPWEANSHSACQEIPRVLMKLEVSFHLHEPGTRS